MLTSRNTWFCGSLVICLADLLLRYSLFLQCRIHLHEHAVHISTPAALLPSWKHHWRCLFAAQLLFKLFHIGAVAPRSFLPFPIEHLSTFAANRLGFTQKATLVHYPVTSPKQVSPACPLDKEQPVVLEPELTQ